MNNNSPKSFSAGPARFSLAAVLTLLASSCGGGGGSGGGGGVPLTPVNGVASTLSADPVTGLLADGQTVSNLSVVLRDATNQPLTGRRVRFVVSGTGNVVTPVEATTDGAGLAVATLASTEAGSKEIAVMADPDSATALTLSQRAVATFVLPGQVTLAAPARFEDRNSSGTADAGDAVVLRFGEPVQVQTSQLTDFALAVTGDTFGTGATVAAGTVPEEIEIRLGQAPVLRTRGLFATGVVQANAPSGIDVSATASGVIAAASGSPVVPSGFLDIAPGMVAAAELSLTAARNLAVGELDGDNDLDLVVTSTGNDRLLFQDDTTGNLVELHQLNDGAATALAVGDLDNRGKDEIVTVGGGSVRVWRNVSQVGQPFFSANATLPVGQGTAVVLMDVNRDGFNDVVVGSVDGVRVFRHGRNLGITLTLEQHLSTLLDVRAMVSADVDRDGDTDLIVGTGSSLHLLRNDGPQLTIENLSSEGALSLSVADVDADLDLDVVVTDGTTARLLRGDGQGGFTTETLTVAAAEVHLADVDGDARADLISRSPQGVLVSQATVGGFETVQELSMPDANDLEVADLDRDGDVDLLVARGDRVVVLHGSLRGTFGRTQLSQGPTQPVATSTALAAGDLDGDGDDDLVVGREGNDIVLLNQGDGNFLPTGQTLGAGLASGATMGDLDGDGDLDVVLVERADPVQTPRWRAWFNDGTGTFEPVSAELPHVATEDARSVAAGDLTNNGRDEVVVGIVGANRVFRLVNLNGNRTFFEIPDVFPPQTNTRDSRALQLIDVDGEGDLDLVVGNFGNGEQNQVYRFSLVNGDLRALDFNAGVNEPTVGVAVADFDRDGRLDVVFANADNGQQFQHAVHSFNGASAIVGPPTRFTSGVAATCVAAADVDGDGFLDLLMGTVAGTVQVWRQQAPLEFAVAQTVAVGGVRALHAGDYDRDGDADAFAATTAADVVLINQ